MKTKFFLLTKKSNNENKNRPKSWVTCPGLERTETDHFTFLCSEVRQASQPQKTTKSSGAALSLSLCISGGPHPRDPPTELTAHLLLLRFGNGKSKPPNHSSLTCSWTTIPCPHRFRASISKPSPS